MKMPVRQSLIAAALLLSIPATAASTDVDNAGAEILREISVARLSNVVGAAKTKFIRLRACEIQRRERIPPTFCYSDDVKDPRELDSLCLSSSLRAQRLPKVDQYTSKSCRDAIGRRGKDLAYVAEENVQRDALR